VVVSDLGTIYFQTSEEDESRLRPVAAAFIHQKILDLRVHAFVSKEGRHVPSSAERDYTLYVVVQDQNKYPVPGAVIVFSIQGNGKEETHRMPLPTNEEGFTSTTIRVRRISDYQMYKILIRVEHSGMEKITETAFWVGN